VPKLYFASPRDLPTKNPTPGMTQKIIRAAAATVAITDLAPKTVVESHKHPMEQTGVVTRGSLVMVIAGEQRILTPGDSYRVPPNASHGARVFEEATQVIDVWAPARDDL
jgi:quercetin dioxygenase-like cupin family protein